MVGEGKREAAEKEKKRAAQQGTTPPQKKGEGEMTPMKKKERKRPDAVSAEGTPKAGAGKQKWLYLVW
jgi:hypothetical protein